MAFAQQGAAPSGSWSPTVTIAPFGAAEGGYDSNPDQRHNGKGSAYETLQAGVRASWQRSPADSYTAYLRGRFFEFQNLDDPHRYDIEAAIGARYDLSANDVVKVGSTYIRDALARDGAQIFRSFGEWIREGSNYQFRLKAQSHTELSLENPAIIPGVAVDVFETTRNAAFDFSKNGGTASLMLLTNGSLSPYIIANVSDVNYMNQSSLALLDRNATDMWVAAGVRTRFSNAVVLDLGARANRREFKDPNFEAYDGVFVDARLSWYAAPTLSFHGLIERQIKEPTTAFGLADEVTTYEVSALKLHGPWSFHLRAYYDLVRPIGEVYEFDKYSVSTGLSYAVNQNVDLYANYTGKYVKERFEDESYTRHQIGAGVRAKF